MFDNASLVSLMLPPPTLEEAQWIYELTKPEEEYYKIRSNPAVAPPKGALLIERTPYSAILKITWPSKDFLEVSFSKDTPRLLCSYGLNLRQVEDAIGYVWSFGKVYVKTSNPELFKPDLPDIK